MITVKNTINGEISTFETMEEAKDFIASEIKWFNSPSENANGNGYDESDFLIEEN